MASPPKTRRDEPFIPAPGTRLEGMALGIDVGGTGVKAALVDLATAELVSDRVREKTPQPPKPGAVAETIRSVVGRVLADRQVPDDLAVGCGLPGVVKDGRLTTAANIGREWIGWPAEERIGAAIGRRVMIINDADAAGLAEVAYGAGEGVEGTVLLLTIGTGIGSGLFIDGALVPNTELGHIEVHGKDAETRLSGAARERRKLGWRPWANEFNFYLSHLEWYLQPDLIILGGGVSKEMSSFGEVPQGAGADRDRDVPEHVRHHRCCLRGGCGRADAASPRRDRDEAPPRRQGRSRHRGRGATRGRCIDG